MTLALIVALPFLGSIIAAFLPSNARNAEAWLSSIALEDVLTQFGSQDLLRLQKGLRLKPEAYTRSVTDPRGSFFYTDGQAVPIGPGMT